MTQPIISEHLFRNIYVDWHKVEYKRKFVYIANKNRSSISLLTISLGSTCDCRVCKIEFTNKFIPLWKHFVAINLKSDSQIRVAEEINLNISIPYPMNQTRPLQYLRKPRYRSRDDTYWFNKTTLRNLNLTSKSPTLIEGYSILLVLLSFKAQPIDMQNRNARASGKIQTLTTTHLFLDFSLHVTQSSGLFFHLFQSFLHFLQLLENTECEQQKHGLEPSDHSHRCLRKSDGMPVCNSVKRKQNIVILFIILGEVLHSCWTPVLGAVYYCKYLRDISHSHPNMTKTPR